MVCLPFKIATTQAVGHKGRELQRLGVFYPRPDYAFSRAASPTDAFQTGFRAHCSLQKPEAHKTPEGGAGFRETFMLADT